MRMRGNSPEQAETERRAMGSGATQPGNVGRTNGEVRTHTENFVERKAPVLFKFEGQGDYVEGKLVAVEQLEIKDNETRLIKKVWQFTIFDVAARQSYKILGSYDITSKLSRDDVGSKVRITLKGVDQTIKKNGNPMKVFEVLVEEKHRRDSGPEITDEDIPF